MYNFIKDYWLDWFPKIPSYQAFNNRLNRLSEVFKHISIEQILIGMSEQREMSINILDSCPIVTCKGNGKRKVARDFTDKSYCSSKKKCGIMV
jgi:transposase